MRLRPPALAVLDVCGAPANGTTVRQNFCDVSLAEQFVLVSIGSVNNDFALIAVLGLLGLRIFEACGANIADLGEEHGHRVLKVRGKGDKTLLVPLPPAVARAIEYVTEGRAQGPILRTRSVGGWIGTPRPAGSSLDRQPNYILAAYLASGT